MDICAGRVLLIEAALDNTAFLQPLQPRRKGVGSDADQARLEVLKLAWPMTQQVAQDEKRPSLPDDAQRCGPPGSPVHNPILLHCAFCLPLQSLRSSIPAGAGLDAGADWVAARRAGQHHDNCYFDSYYYSDGYLTSSYILVATT